MPLHNSHCQAYQNIPELGFLLLATLVFSLHYIFQSANLVQSENRITKPGVWWQLHLLDGVWMEPRQLVDRHFIQVCQNFLGVTYQNWKNLPNYHKIST
jgi:hypothetical protein